MFGMELWFVLAIVSAIAGGLFIFVTKVAAERDYDVVIMNTIAVAVSAIIFLSILLYRGDYSGFNMFMVGVATVNGILYMWVHVLRHYALQCIDTAIYFPLYKTLTPLIAIIVGYLLLHERFSAYEWIGLILSLLVPLLLITHAEKHRQKDLWRGLRLMVIAAFAAVVTAFAVKIGTDATDNTWLFIFVTDIGLVIVGLITVFQSRKKKPIRQRLENASEKTFIILSLILGLLSTVSFGSLVFAFEYGTLSIVYTVQSLYILIPIILSIIYYNEHWNLRKVVAIVLSIAALALLK